MFLPVNVLNAEGVYEFDEVGQPLLQCRPVHPGVPMTLSTRASQSTTLRGQGEGEMNYLAFDESSRILVKRFGRESLIFVD